ncbi:predicted protein [Chaetomium globosum CBS 148.51]|uniref:Uncharacterized protein n=1 Tax=Chaetomium globosum (strain ATCC 6205 / CBS 148.51 / DSM 1962 / NBRC 6347 / NRRL 1970) TaxID=306901 RepID=Q2H767_CHAGB|nr:uncharacterized protein CHGG_05498 [Chaetomium globosum CBS 148.51]EAQ88879.1 predicted protein [Chaetomium globosum CBS 148.51]
MMQRKSPVRSCGERTQRSQYHQTIIYNSAAIGWPVKREAKAELGEDAASDI